MSGKVYVFNSYNESVSQLLVHQNDAGAIPGWESGDTNKYSPQSVAVTRSEYPSDSEASFSYGSNDLSIRWTSYNGTTTISIPDSSSLVDDLIVYITLDKAILMDTRGHVMSINDVHYKVMAKAAVG